MSGHRCEVLTGAQNHLAEDQAVAVHEGDRRNLEFGVLSLLYMKEAEGLFMDFDTNIIILVQERDGGNLREVDPSTILHLLISALCLNRNAFDVKVVLQNRLNCLRVGCVPEQHLSCVSSFEKQFLLLRKEPFF